MNPKQTPGLISLAILAGLFLASLFLAGILQLFSGGSIGSAVVQVIPVTGEIMTSSPSGFFAPAIRGADELVEAIEQANKDPLVKGIILEINSPGGTAVASEEVAQAVKRSEKPVVAWIREGGASGAYWVASAADHIIASRMSITGSVGVISSYLEFGGLLERFNITHQRLVAGERKDLGSPYREMTPEEEQFMLLKLEKIQDYFVSDVAANRDLTPEQTARISTGEIFLGEEALELGLIDEIGSRQEAVAYFENLLNTTVTLRYIPTSTGLFGMVNTQANEKAYYAGQGFSAGLLPGQGGIMAS